MQYLLRIWLFFFGASQMWLSSYKMHLVAVTHTSKCCVRMWWEQNTQLLCGIGNRMSSIWILGTNQFQWENVVGFSVGSLFFWPEWPLIRCAHTYYSSRGDDVDSVLLFFRFSLFCINVTLEAFERLTMLNSNSKQNEGKQWHNKWNRSMESSSKLPTPAKYDCRQWWTKNYRVRVYVFWTRTGSNSILTSYVSVCVYSKK